VLGEARCPRVLMTSVIRVLRLGACLAKVF